jgi:hypothetical protein
MVGLFIRGTGMGTVTIPLMTAGFRGLSRNEVPDASVISRCIQQVGGSFGTAVLAVIVAGAATSPTTDPGAALDRAYQHGFWFSLGFTAIGVVLSLMLPAEVPTPPAFGPARGQSSAQDSDSAKAASPAQAATVRTVRQIGSAEA